ncbi:unnamed protein product [Haemonchus placei]|uniref:Uncharacterized protein n=1 Tax=Haemonchus placei TaxID=6290 RepID=A0A0N4VXC9_HAEPC|nr:unnamed protein product [Haemonchus placei]
MAPSEKDERILGRSKPELDPVKEKSEAQGAHWRREKMSARRSQFPWLKLTEGFKAESRGCIEFLLISPIYIYCYSKMYVLLIS